MRKKTKIKTKKPMPLSAKQKANKLAAKRKLARTKIAQPRKKGSKKREKLFAKMEELVAKGKKRGFITYDEILRMFPNIEDDVFLLDELYEKLSLTGIDALESRNMLDLEE